MQQSVKQDAVEMANKLRQLADELEQHGIARELSVEVPMLNVSTWESPVMESIPTNELIVTVRVLFDNAAEVAARLAL